MIEDDYNCFGAVIAGSQGREIKRGVGINFGSRFQDILEQSYSPASTNNLQFGKTIIRFANDKNAVKHAAIYYGTGPDGTVYVYTKNGWELKPEIMKLTRVNNSTELRYGTIKGMQSSHSGYYNPK